MKKMIIFFIVLLSISYCNNVSDVHAKTVKEIRRELINMYGPEITKAIGSDWIIQDMKKTTLLNPDGTNGNYLVVLAFKARSTDREIDRGKILVYQIVNESIQKKWTSTESIEADFGIIEKVQGNLTGEHIDSIVVTFLAGRLNHVWIYLWEGDKAELISPKDTGNNNLSLFKGPDGDIWFDDVDNDGIAEIIVGEHYGPQTPGGEVDKHLNYKWNPVKRQFYLWKTDIVNP